MFVLLLPLRHNVKKYLVGLTRLMLNDKCYIIIATPEKALIDKIYFSKSLTLPEERLIQTDHWPSAKILDSQQLKTLLMERIQQIDFDQAKEDVLPFVTDPASMAFWSKPFFSVLVQKMDLDG